MFARLIARRKGKSISGKEAFGDVSSKEGYYSYIGYLAKYDIIKGYSDKTFRPNAVEKAACSLVGKVNYFWKILGHWLGQQMGQNRSKNSKQHPLQLRSL